MRRVVVTGIGAVSPLGNTAAATWQALLQGRSGIGKIQKFDTSGLTAHIAGEVKGLNPDDWMNPREAALCDPFLHFAVAASTMALDDSKLLQEPGRAERTGTCIATGAGGMNVIMTQLGNLTAKGARFVSPMTVPFTICDMASGYVSIKHKLEGPNHALVSACASGAAAIGEAYHMIRRGSVEAMVAGGSDSLSLLNAAAFASARALAASQDPPEKASRPFDSKRDGFVLAEGAASVVLEELEQAKARGATIYGELVGYGSCSDAYHLTAPDPSGKGAARSMREAIQMAGIEKDQIGYVNAHATSTQQGDKVEVVALREVFGGLLDKLPVGATKSMTGHMIGAAGAIEAIFCLLAMRDGVLPPTINQENPDPECNLDTVPNVARNQSVEYALSNSFGFGGHNVSLLFRRWN